VVTRVALDGFAVRESGAGVSRVLRQVLPLLASQQGRIEYVTLTTAEGARLLSPLDCEMVVVPHMPKTVWEQSALPWHSSRLKAKAIYTHSECAPLWGPPALLHVPEDPYLRWVGTPATTAHEHVRRAYQRLMVRRSVYRSPLLVTSCRSIACALKARFGDELPVRAIVPLGVDSNIFYPDVVAPREDMVFHLGSAEPRDQSALVVRAYAEALKTTPGLPDLAIAGKLGERTKAVAAAIDETGLASRAHLLGYLSDDDLRLSYSHAAMCLQPARYEGFGLQPLEALACASPLVVFPEKAVLEVIGDAAVVAREQSQSALSKAISELWCDPALRASLRARGPERAALFTWAATAQRLHELLVAWLEDGHLVDLRGDLGPSLQFRTPQPGPPASREGAPPRRVTHPGT